MNSYTLGKKFQLSGLCALIATIVLAVLSFNTQFTFSTDDYTWLHMMEKGGISWNVFREHWSRVPLQNIAVWVMYTTGFINDTNQYFYFVAYFFHCFSLCLLSVFILENINLKEKINFKQSLIVLVLISLYPNNFEIIFWATTFPYIWGSFFLAMAFSFPSFILRFFLIVAAYMTTESFILPALCLCVFAAITRKDMDKKKIMKSFLYWMGTLVFFILYRKIASVYLGEPKNKLVVDPLNVLVRIPILIKQTFFLHFYKTSIANSILFLIAQALLFWKLVSKEVITKSMALRIVPIIFLSCCIYLLIDYIAPRALYGGHLFVMAAYGALLLILWEQSKKQKTVPIIISMMGISFLMHHFYIFKTKNYNSKIIESRITDLKQQMQNCKAPCLITTGQLNHGLKRDWVLHKDYYPFFLGYLKEKYFPQKKIRFKHPK